MHAAPALSIRVCRRMAATTWCSLVVLALAVCRGGGDSTTADSVLLARSRHPEGWPLTIGKHDPYRITFEQPR